MKTKNTETFNIFCQGCLKRKSLHNIYQRHFNKEHKDVEIYSEMLFSCFSIKINSDLTDKEKKYFMCTECIVKLKDAFRFKLQIEYTQAVLQEMSKLHTSKEGTHDDLNSEYDNIEEDSDEWPESTNSYEINTNKRFECENSSVMKVSTSKEKQRKKNDAIEITNHPPYIPDASELQCRICDKTFLFNFVLKEHLNSHFQNFICEKCGKAFSVIKALNIHMLAEHESIVHACPSCPRTYKTSEALHSHKKSHLNAKTFRCKVCLERFETHKLRSIHEQSEHEIIKKRYKCVECPKDFSHRGVLIAHVRKIHLMERKCICQECGVHLFNNMALTRHMLVHTGERNFECDVCHKCYGRKSTLRGHMKIHYNIKKFICPICKRAFTQNCTLKGHMKVHLKQTIK